MYPTVRLGAEGKAAFDDINGDLTPQWGMHLVDVNLALGNLIDVVGARAKAWQTAH